MIYRIDMQHFLTHAIDHFTTSELTHFQYAIISAKIRNGNRSTNVVKLNNFYPSPEIVASYAEYQDKGILEKMYMEMMKPDKGDNDWIANAVYQSFINPLIRHVDVVMICDRIENDYIDIFCKYLKKSFSIEVIDLNQLFSEGRVGEIYIDREEIKNKAVDIRRACTKEQIKSLESTRDGKLRLLNLMTKKNKISKLKELGIKVTEADKENLDKLLVDEWVDNDNEND